MSINDVLLIIFAKRRSLSALSYRHCMRAVRTGLNNLHNMASSVLFVSFPDIFNP